MEQKRAGEQTHRQQGLQGRHLYWPNRRCSGGSRLCNRDGDNPLGRRLPGMGDKLVAVPVNQIKVGSEAKFTTDVTKEQLPPPLLSILQS